MVNPGHPSRGCYECRRKKVKCDNTRPHCLRCRKARRVCPGFSDVQFKVLVAPPTSDITITQGSSSFMSRMDFCSPSPDSTTEYVAPHIQSPGYTPDSLFTIMITPSPYVEDLAIPIFFNAFTTSSPRHTTLGMMTFLPQMYAQSNQDSCLRLAVDATAHASAMRQLRIGNNMPLARTKHVAALSAVRNALLHNASAIENSTLCSLYLLTLFEYVSGDTVISHGSHISGYEALLLLRSQHFGSENDWLYQSVVSSILVKYLRGNSLPPPEIVAVLKANLNSGPRCQCTSHSLEVIQLRAQVSRIMHENDNNEVELLRLFAFGARINEEFQHWPDTNDVAWSFTTIYSSSSELSEGPIHIYPELLSATTWNFHRCVRIILLQTLLQCGEGLLSTSSSYSATNIQTALATFQLEISTLIQDIITSYPYILGLEQDEQSSSRKPGVALGGYTLIWPIGLILRCPLATTGQKMSTVAALDYIGHVLGFRRALDLKNTWTGGAG